VISKIFPGLVPYLAVIFLVLAILETVNLTLIGLQEVREKVIKQEPNDR
jgi:hypothetical protein